MLPVEQMQGTPYFRNIFPKVVIENLINNNNNENCEKVISTYIKNEKAKIPNSYTSQVSNNSYNSYLSSNKKLIETQLSNESPATKVSANQTNQSEIDQSAFKIETVNNKIVRKQNTVQSSTQSNKMFEEEKLSAEKPINEIKITGEKKFNKASLFKHNNMFIGDDSIKKEFKSELLDNNQIKEILELKKLDFSKVDQIKLPQNKKLRESRSLSPPNSTPISGNQNQKKDLNKENNVDEFGPNSKTKINNPYISKPLKNKLVSKQEFEKKTLKTKEIQNKNQMFPKCKISSINIKKDGDSIIESNGESVIFEMRKDDSILSPNTSMDQTPYGFAKYAKRTEKDFELNAEEEFIYEEYSEESFSKPIIEEQLLDNQKLNECEKFETPVNKEEEFTCMGEI